jgi:hypothetical protein
MLRYAHCMTSLRFGKALDIASIPSDWQLVRLTLDWAGCPLLLFVEGKPPQPDFHTDRDAWSAWCRTPPKAHHVVFQEAGQLQSLAFDQSQGLSTFHLQRFEEGWLLGERRGGKTKIYDKHGAVRATLDLGDASEDLQTTPDGLIWVSYFDEGVFGSGIGGQGLVCFNRVGDPAFKYAEFAEQNALPMIADCYAMNVDSTGAVWINYYTDFPLVRLSNFKLDQIWNEFGVLGKTFAVRGNELIHLREDRLATSSLIEPRAPEPIFMQAVDESGIAIRYADIAARGMSLAINTNNAVYTLLN